jgi:hypothetical protein
MTLRQAAKAAKDELQSEAITVYLRHRCRSQDCRADFRQM